MGYGYDEEVTGGALRLGRELSEYLRGDLVYRLDLIDITNISSGATYLEEEKGSNLISSITPSLTFDSRDNIFDTHKGNLLSGSIEFAGGPLGGIRTLKCFSRASHYIHCRVSNRASRQDRAGRSLWRLGEYQYMKDSLGRSLYYQGVRRKKRLARMTRN